MMAGNEWKGLAWIGLGWHGVRREEDESRTNCV